MLHTLVFTEADIYYSILLYVPYHSWMQYNILKASLVTACEKWVDIEECIYGFYIFLRDLAVRFGTYQVNMLVWKDQCSVVMYNRTIKLLVGFS